MYTKIRNEDFLNCWCRKYFLKQNFPGGNKTLYQKLNRINSALVYNFMLKGILGSNSRFLRGNYRRLKKYMYDFWNAVDLLSYVLLIIALFVRHFYPSTTFTIARRMFSLSVLVMYLRFLEVFLIHRRLGPTLIMIKEMVKYNWNLYLILKNNSR